jgi:hypothetical protein
MKLYDCACCGNLLYFENVACTRCGAVLGFVPEDTALTAFEPGAPGEWLRLGNGRRYRMCTNYVVHAVCNWMVEAGQGDAFCVACRLNHTIPDLRVAGNLTRWHTLELEKRRLVYSLLRLGLQLVPRSVDARGLAFDFLADAAPSFSERGRVLTGHVAGLITLNIAEADPVVRERMRSQMAEPYRTLLGHFRHESGHYFWDRIVRTGARLFEFRRLFGDERADYETALQHHYDLGPAEDWRAEFVSAYASAHPWEDWAETWAHYLHIVDTLETAYQFGLDIRLRAGDDKALSVRHDFDPYAVVAFRPLIEHWLPLSFALNSLNRSMGHEQAYPFVLSPKVIEKLGFVHDTVRAFVQGDHSVS